MTCVVQYYRFYFLLPCSWNSKISMVIFTKILGMHETRKDLQELSSAMKDSKLSNK